MDLNDLRHVLTRPTRREQLHALWLRFRAWWLTDAALVLSFWLGWLVGIVCGILLMRMAVR